MAIFSFGVLGTLAVLFCSSLYYVDANVNCTPPCVNGLCIDNATCVCSTGYTGELCDVLIVADCDVNPCMNQGNCSMVATSLVCDCPDGFNGSRCENNVTDRCENGNIRLVDGRDNTEGRVEVCSDNKWGTVCNDGWDIRDATVACTQSENPNFVLGIPECFPPGEGEIVLSRLRCLGTESSLFDCEEGEDLGCLHVEDAGVRCLTIFELDPRNQVCINGVLGDDNFTCVCSPGYTGSICDVPLIAECDVNPCQNGGNCSMVATTPACTCPEGLNGPICSTSNNEADQCILGEIRLVDGDSDTEGRVEVCFGGVFGTVCDDLWDENDAIVACRQLFIQQGITFGGIVATPRCYGQGNGPIWLDNLRCASNEGNLFGCPNNGIMNHDCLHYEDAGVQCSLFLCDPPCDNGVCIDDNTCACSTGYSGELCAVPIITECDVNPCQNGGNCSTVAVTPVCDCPDDFGGPRCEIPLLKLAVEKSVYSVVEGEYLEVCIIIVSGTVTFSFAIRVDLITPTFTIHQSIQIEVGVTRTCFQLHILDLGNSLEYSVFKEYPLKFSLESPELADTISVQNNQSWLHIIDNDIVHLGFSEHGYEVKENTSSVNVCFELMDGALTGRPIVFKAFSSDGSAVAGSDYIAVEKILSMPVWSKSGDKTCFDVQIINDNVIEETEQFVIHFLVHDLNVDIPMAYARADVNIIDDDVPEEFVIQFSGDTPAVNGDQVFVSFSSSVPVESATCSVTTQPSIDCSSGSAQFGPLPRNRRSRYTITIEATFRDETRIIERRFRSETTGVCGAHLIGEGVVVDDGTISILLQATGPTEETRLSEFECRVDSNRNSDYFSCGGSPLRLSATPGDHEVDIRPLDPDQTCRQRRALSVTYTV